MKTIYYILYDYNNLWGLTEAGPRIVSGTCKEFHKDCVNWLCDGPFGSAAAAKEFLSK